ncbi:hypothetical protein RHSIM_Rhsim07G0235400 [Rhododendron simsii]|uniref:Uncharacterized protein n=1 Tax=Rhododendron simsii TaxID=118357 RepID=A0A834GP15_RHOSS|nr:hypothetical protein RHSIM_Rhsim07G0235400 [Rhododendron simsii]
MEFGRLAVMKALIKEQSERAASGVIASYQPLRVYHGREPVGRRNPKNGTLIDFMTTRRNTLPVICTRQWHGVWSGKEALSGCSPGDVD